MCLQRLDSTGISPSGNTHGEHLLKMIAITSRLLDSEFPPTVAALGHACVGARAHEESRSRTATGTRSISSQPSIHQEKLRDYMRVSLFLSPPLGHPTLSRLQLIQLCAYGNAARIFR